MSKPRPSWLMSTMSLARLGILVYVDEYARGLISEINTSERQRQTTALTNNHGRFKAVHKEKLQENYFSDKSYFVASFAYCIAVSGLCLVYSLTSFHAMY